MNDLLCNLTESEMREIHGGEGVRVFVPIVGDVGQQEFVLNSDDTLYFRNPSQGTSSQITGTWYNYLLPILKNGGDQSVTEVV